MSISVPPFDVTAYSSNAETNDVAIGAKEAEATTIWDLDQIKIDPACALRVPKQFAQRKKLLPLCRVHEKVVVAGTGPIDAATSRSLKNLLKSDFEIIQSTDASLRRALSRAYDRAALPESRPDEELPSTLRTSANQADRDVAEQLSDEVIRAAILRNASDIHLIPGSSHSTIRLRVDGELETYREIPPFDHEPLLNRLKVLAGMDVTERRVAQDGRITVKSDNGRRKLELRAACIPTRFGQRMTLRLLNLERSDVSLSSLGMGNEQVRSVEDVLRTSHGLVLITGPTGSGKSTTLLAAIETWMKQVGGNVLTIEDPIEY
ncbi:MAG: ATPase, T2SS/T4P/T4SS family, partial [Pirellulales bacterium]